MHDTRTATAAVPSSAPAPPTSTSGGNSIFFFGLGALLLCTIIAYVGRGECAMLLNVREMSTESQTYTHTHTQSPVQRRCLPVVAAAHWRRFDTICVWCVWCCVRFRKYAAPVNSLGRCLHLVLTYSNNRSVNIRGRHSARGHKFKENLLFALTHRMRVFKF